MQNRVRPPRAVSYLCPGLLSHEESFMNPANMNKRNKRRVAIALYHRDRLSLGANRAKLGFEAYHWGILVMPKQSTSSTSRRTRRRHPLKCNAYDATDLPIIDPITRQDSNPNLEWFFRPQHGIDPSATGRLIGRVIVGKLPPTTTDSDIDALLGKVPLPVKDASPPESCVTWAIRALGSLQAAGLAWQFDLDEFRDWALAYGDRCMANMGPDHVYEFPRQPLAVG